MTNTVPRRRRTTAVGALALAPLLALTACGGGSAGSSSTADIDDITIALRNDTDSFDPAITAAENGAVQITEALYDTLIRRDIETGEYVPAMASEWEVTPTRVDFTLKPDLTCADGTPLKPTDVAASIERLGDPETGSIYTGRVFGGGGLKSVTADDDANTLSVEVAEPHTDLLEGLRSGGFIVCPKGLEDPEALATVPQGSGPYKLVSSSRGDTYEFERWDSPAVENIEDLPEKITMKVVTSEATRANLLETGSADIVSILGRDAQRLDGKFEKVLGEGYQADTLVFNQRPGFPGADQLVREAVAHAVDAEEYTTAASFGIGKPIDTIWTPNVDCFTESNGDLKPQQDLELAKEKLAEAGYGPGGKTLKLRLLGYDAQNSGPDYVAEALRSIGIEVEVMNGTLAQGAAIIYGDKEPWDVFVFPFMTASPTPYPAVTKMSSLLGEGGAYNFGRVHNDEFDKYSEEAPGLTGDERCEAWGNAEAALLERVDAVPLMWPIANYYADGLTFKTEHRTIDLRSIALAD